MRISPIITDYFHAWLEQDCDKFLGTISDDFYARECTGDVYEGKEIARRWFESWHTGDHQVLCWEIDQAWQLDNRHFVTWTFTCRYDNNLTTFKGISHLLIKNNKICQLNEYSQEAENKYPYGRPNHVSNET